MRKHFPLILLTSAVFILWCADPARAQGETSIPKYPWLDVVTTAQPTFLQRCKVVSLNSHQLVCKARHHGTTTYLMSDVTALIDPAFNEHFGLFALPFLAGGGALIYAAVIASSAFATAGLSIAAFAAFGAIVAMAVGDNSTSEDTLVYKKRGTILSSALHLKLEPYNDAVVIELPQ